MATELFAQILSRAIEESHQPAPPVDLTLDTLVASLNMPLNWITKKITDVKDRMQIEAMYREYQQKGKVIERLPEDDKLVRELIRAWDPIAQKVVWEHETSSGMRGYDGGILSIIPIGSSCGSCSRSRLAAQIALAAPADP